MVEMVRKKREKGGRTRNSRNLGEERKSGGCGLKRKVFFELTFYAYVQRREPGREKD